MRIALISDIHGNLESLDAVLADIDRQQIDKVYCLGDVVGYGPNPGECLDRIMHCDLCLLGDWDEVVRKDDIGSGPDSRHISWTRRQLKQGAAARRRLEFLDGLNPLVHVDGFQLVHGSAQSSERICVP